MGKAARSPLAEFLKAAMSERLNPGVAVGRGRLGEPQWQRDAERNTEEKVPPPTSASPKGFPFTHGPKYGGSLSRLSGVPLAGWKASRQFPQMPS